MSRPAGQKARFIMFRMNGCIHCERSKPAFELAKRTLEGMDVAQVEEYEVSAHPQVIKDFGVEGFPTFILEKPDGTRVTYNGSRTAEDFVSFVANH